jgi:high-affinity K+ transport system ATPase subunit B
MKNQEIKQAVIFFAFIAIVLIAMHLSGAKFN